MNKERDPDYSNSGIVDLVKRYEEMIRKSTRYYFDVDGFEEIIDHYLSSGKSNFAFNAAQHALRQHPSSISIRLKKAMILNEKAQPLESLSILRNIEKIELNNPEIYFTKGITLILLNNIPNAVREFNKAVFFTDEGKADIMFNIAIALEQNNHFKTALNYLLQAHDLEPDNLSYIFDIAYCYEKNDQPEKALNYYNRFLDIDPFSENAWYNMGVLHNQMENYQKAIEAYDFAISLDEEYVSAYFNKANTLANMGDHKEAIAVYKELLYQEEDNEQVFCYIGECYEKMKQWERALSYYRKSLVINPEHADAWLGYGMVIFAKGSYLESLYYVEKAIKYFPENSEYWYSLGNIYIKLDRKEDAKIAYRKAVTYDPQDLDSWLNLAEIFRSLRKKNAAIQVLEEASRTNPGNAFLNYRLAAYHLMNKNSEKADYYLRIALSLNYDLHKDFFAYYPRAAKLKAVKKLIDSFYQ